MRVRFVLRVFGAALALTLAAGAVPSARGQASALYFPATGHTLVDDSGFLSYWRAHDGERLLGLPISEPILAAEGDTTGIRAVQYFERGRLEQRVDPATGASAVAPGPVALEYVEALFRSFPPAPPRRPALGVRFFAETDHTLRAPFLSFWQAVGGMEMLGPPISEALWEMTPSGRRQVQYFTNARLERDASLAGTPGEIQVSDLGRSLALLRGLDLAPVANPGFELAGPATPLAPDVAPLVPTPTPAPVPVAPAAPAQAAPRAEAPVRRGGARSILVNLSDQWLYAYEGDVMVFDAPVATGRDGMNTPTGTFSIYAKLKVQTMDGVTNGEYWVVPNVPNVMYFTGDVALHGTYWHNLFGSGARPSHGCVNLPLDAAAWLYNWAPVGTTVRVTY